MNQKQTKILLKLIPKFLLLIIVIGGLLTYLYVSFILPKQNKEILNSPKAKSVLKQYNENRSKEESDIVSIDGISTILPKDWKSIYQLLEKDKAKQYILIKEESSHYEGVVLTVFDKKIDNQFTDDLMKQFHSNQSFQDLLFFPIQKAKYNGFETDVLPYTYLESGTNKMNGNIFLFNHNGKHFTIDVKGENLNDEDFQFIERNFSL